MKELMVMMATMMPEEKLLNDLRDAINDYLILPTNEKIDEISTFCTMVIIRHATKGDADTAMNMIRDMDKMEKSAKIFDIKEN